jgi:hypothetical protein
MSDSAPKSALEIALERLRKQDEATGVVDTPLTDEQKASIADARNFCEAKLAERRILHDSKLATTFEPEARAVLEEEYRRDVDRLTGDRDRRIARIRKGERP